MAKKKFDIDQGFEQLDEILTKLSGEDCIRKVSGL